MASLTKMGMPTTVASLQSFGTAGLTALLASLEREAEVRRAKGLDDNAPDVRVVVEFPGGTEREYLVREGDTLQDLVENDEVLRPPPPAAAAAVSLPSSVHVAPYPMPCALCSMSHVPHSQLTPTLHDYHYHYPYHYCK